MELGIWLVQWLALWYECSLDKYDKFFSETEPSCG